MFEFYTRCAWDLLKRSGSPDEAKQETTFRPINFLFSIIYTFLRCSIFGVRCSIFLNFEHRISNTEHRSISQPTPAGTQAVRIAPLIPNPKRLRTANAVCVSIRVGCADKCTVQPTSGGF